MNFLRFILTNLEDFVVLTCCPNYWGNYTSPIGYFVGIATQKWRNEITENGGDRDSLAKAGIWIGIIERVLVLTFVLLKQFEAIGFLIAAKSILRFSDKDEEHPRKQTEYVLIGTLLSFTIALFVGLIVLSNI